MREKKRKPGRPPGSGFGRTQKRYSFGIDDHGKVWEDLYAVMQKSARIHLSASAATNAIYKWLKPEIDAGHIKVGDILGADSKAVE